MHKFSFLALSIVIVVFTSCNSTPENLLVIPKQTEVVLAVNISSLVVKSGIGTGDVGSELFNQSKREMRRHKKLVNNLDDLVKDVSFISTDNSNFEFTLNFNDDSENSLFGLLTFIEDNVDEIKDLD